MALSNISPDKIEQNEIAAVTATLTADLFTAITAAGGTPPTSGANIAACIAALVVDITGALSTARTVSSGGQWNYTIDPNLAAS
jgi:hypothetical protein